MKRQRRYIADPHLGHEKLAHLRGFDTVVEHDDEFLQAWRRSGITEDTEVFLLGDLSSGGAEPEARAHAILSSLPGIKHLVLGNHDRLHPLQKNGRKNFRAYADVFASVSIADQVNIDGHKVMLSHFPYHGEHGDEPDRHPSWRLRNTGKWLVHGHVHDEWTIQGRQICVSWEKWRDRFATDNDIAKLIAWGERLEAETYQMVMDHGGGS